MDNFRKLITDVTHLFEAPSDDDIKMTDINDIARDNLNSEPSGKKGTTVNGSGNSYRKTQARKVNLKSFEDDAKRNGWFIVNPEKIKKVFRADHLKQVQVRNKINPKTNAEVKPNKIESFIKKYPGVSVYTDDINIGTELTSEQKHTLTSKLGYKLYTKTSGTKAKPAGTYAKITYVVVDADIDTTPKQIDPAEYTKDISKLPKEEQDLFNDGYKFNGNEWIKTVDASKMSKEEIKKLKDNGWDIKTKKGKPVSATNSVDSRSKHRVAQFYKLHPEIGGDYNEEDTVTNWMDDVADASADGGGFDYDTKGDSKKSTAELMRLFGARAKAKHNQYIGDNGIIMDLVKKIRSPFTGKTEADAYFKELLEHTINMALRRYREQKYGAIFPDLMQIFGIELYKACFTYNPEYSLKSTDGRGKQAKFTTYLFKNMNDVIRSYISRNLNMMSASRSKKEAFMYFNSLKDEALQKSLNDEEQWSPEKIAQYVVQRMNAKGSTNFQIQPSNTLETWKDAYIRFERQAELFRLSKSIDQSQSTDDGEEYNPVENEISADNEDVEDRIDSFNLNKENMLSAISYVNKNNAISQSLKFSDKEMKFLIYSFGLEGERPLSGDSLASAVGANNRASLSTIKKGAVKKLVLGVKGILGVNDENEDEIDSEELERKISDGLTSLGNANSRSSGAKSGNDSSAYDAALKSHEGYNDVDVDADDAFINAYPELQARGAQISNTRNQHKSFADKFQELSPKVQNQMKELQHEMNDILKMRSVNELAPLELLKYYKAVLSLAKVRYEAGLDTEKTYNDSANAVMKLVNKFKNGK